MGSIAFAKLTCESAEVRAATVRVVEMESTHVIQPGYETKLCPPFCGRGIRHAHKCHDY